MVAVKLDRVRKKMCSDKGRQGKRSERTTQDGEAKKWDTGHTWGLRETGR